MAGDVATAGTAGGGVTQAATGQHGPEDRELHEAGNGVSPSIGAPDVVVHEDSSPDGDAAPREIAGAEGSAAGNGQSGVRRRLGRFGSPRGGGVNPVLEPLIRTVRTTHPKADIREIETDIMRMLAEVTGSRGR